MIAKSKGSQKDIAQSEAACPEGLLHIHFQKNNGLIRCRNKSDSCRISMTIREEKSSSRLKRSPELSGERSI
jgi:hypothetical protein